MVFAFLQAKQKRSLKRRSALTKKGGKHYLEIARFQRQGFRSGDVSGAFSLPKCLLMG
jgi:hypothetical protein